MYFEINFLENIGNSVTFIFTHSWAFKTARFVRKKSGIINTDFITISSTCCPLYAVCSVYLHCVISFRLMRRQINILCVSAAIVPGYPGPLPRTVGQCQFADVRQFAPEFDKFACSAAVTLRWIYCSHFFTIQIAITLPDLQFNLPPHTARPAPSRHSAVVVSIRYSMHRLSCLLSKQSEVNKSCRFPFDIETENLNRFCVFVYLQAGSLHLYLYLCICIYYMCICIFCCICIYQRWHIISH